MRLTCLPIWVKPDRGWKIPMFHLLDQLPLDPTPPVITKGTTAPRTGNAVIWILTQTVRSVYFLSLDISRYTAGCTKVFVFF